MVSPACRARGRCIAAITCAPRLRSTAVPTPGYEEMCRRDSPHLAGAAAERRRRNQPRMPAATPRPHDEIAAAGDAWRATARWPPRDGGDAPRDTRRESKLNVAKRSKAEKECAIRTDALDRPQRLRFLVYWRASFAGRARSRSVLQPLVSLSSAGFLSNLLVRSSFVRLTET